jgi:hypothetical protein
LDKEVEEDRDANVAGISLGLGSLPTVAIGARLFQATQGWKTGAITRTPGTQNPQDLFNLLKALIDAEIQLFLQGLITLDQLANYIANYVTHDLIAALGFIDNSALAAYRFLTADALAAYNFVTSGQLLQQIDNEINAVVPGLIPAAQTLTKDAVNALYGVDLSVVKDLTTVQNTVSGLVSWAKSLTSSSSPNLSGYKGAGDVHTNR